MYLFKCLCTWALWVFDWSLVFLSQLHTYSMLCNPLCWPLLAPKPPWHKTWTLNASQSWFMIVWFEVVYFSRQKQQLWAHSTLLTWLSNHWDHVFPIIWIWFVEVMRPCLLRLLSLLTAQSWMSSTAPCLSINTQFLLLRVLHEPRWHFHFHRELFTAENSCAFTV